MRILSGNETAILELLAIKPLRFMPHHIDFLAKQLRGEGFVIKKNGRWYPTARGLRLIGRTVH